MVTNRVHKVLVTTGVEGASLAALAAGEFVILKRTGAKLVAADTIAAEDEIQIVTALASGEKVFSDLIKVKDITAFNKQAYRAKVEQVVTVTAAAPVAGHEYSISIIDKSDKDFLQMRQAKKTYTVNAVTGDTDATIATKLRAKINADKSAIVVASGATNAIILTAKSVATVADKAGRYPNQTVFEVFTEDVDVTAFSYRQAWGTITATTAADYGSGNLHQLRKLEAAGQGYLGITNQTLFPADAAVYGSSAGNYDVYVIESEDSHDTNVVTVGRWKSPITTIVAVTAGAGTALEAILSPFIGSAANEAVGVDA